MGSKLGLKLGQSLKILFDVIMTQFEDYNPTNMYDASCLAEDVRMDREPERFWK